MAEVSLTFDELTALRKVVYAALAHPALAAEAGEIHLHTADRKLARSALALACRHCAERPSRRSNGLCDRCNSYNAKYGQLPSEMTLLTSSRRRQNRARRTRPVGPSDRPAGR